MIHSEDLKQCQDGSAIKACTKQPDIAWNLRAPPKTETPRPNKSTHARSHWLRIPTGVPHCPRRIQEPLDLGRWIWTSLPQPKGLHWTAVWLELVEPRALLGWMKLVPRRLNKNWQSGHWVPNRPVLLWRIATTPSTTALQCYSHTSPQVLVATETCFVLEMPCFNSHTQGPRA